MLGSTAQKVLEKANEIYKEYLTMSANFENLERTFEKFTIDMERVVDKMRDENEDLRRRVTKLEAMVDATFQKSMEQAIVTVVREELKRKGTVGSVQIENLTEGLSPHSKNVLPPSIDEQPGG